jgi:hypothetical protein
MAYTFQQCFLRVLKRSSNSNTTTAKNIFNKYKFSTSSTKNAVNNSNNNNSRALKTFLIGSGTLGFIYATHWSYENLNSSKAMKSTFKVPFLLENELYVKSNTYFTLACALPFLKLAPSLDKIRSTPNILVKYSVFATFFVCSISGLCGSYYKNSRKERETCENVSDAVKEYLYGVGFTIPFYALALNQKAKLTSINKLGVALFLSIISIESYYNSKLMVQQSYMRKALRSNAKDSKGSNNIHLDMNISSLLNHPSRRAHSFRHPEMLDNILISLSIAMCGAGTLGLIFGPLLLSMYSFENVDREDAILMIGEKEKRMKNIMFPIISTRNIVERKLYLKENVLKIKLAPTNGDNNDDSYLDTSAIRGSWIIEESYKNSNNNSNNKDILSAIGSNFVFPSRDKVGSMVSIARCPPNKVTGDLLISLDNGERSYKAILMDKSDGGNSDNVVKAKYIMKPWIQPTGDDNVDNSTVRNILKYYMNPKIHLDANSFLFSNENRELHFIKYGKYNRSNDEYLVIVDGNSKTNFYILSRKGNLRDHPDGIYNEIVKDLRNRGFYTL